MTNTAPDTSRRRQQPWLRLAGLGAVVLAIGAGTYVVLGRGATQPSTTQVLENGVLTSVPNKTVILLVDVSGSTRATDVKPSRLEAAVAAMETLVEQLPKRFEVGVVSFSTTAMVLEVPTSDHRRVLRALHYLSPEASTALGDGLTTAVHLAVDTLAHEGIRRAPGHYLPAVIVLESDGHQNRGTFEPLEAAEFAKTAGIRVFGVAVGTPGGTADFGGPAPVAVPPDRKTVAQIARVTGGQSFTAPSAERAEASYRTLAGTISR